MTKLANAPRLDDLYKMVAYTYSDKNMSRSVEATFAQRETHGPPQRVRLTPPGARLIFDRARRESADKFSETSAATRSA